MNTKWSCVWVVLLFSLTAAAQTKIAVLRQSTGDVSVRHGTQWTQVTQTPVDLFDGDKVASNRGRAEVFYPSDGSVLTVDVGSNVTIHQAQNSSGGWLRRVQVYVGDVFFHISKTAETNNKWQLATPTAVGGVQGTEGQIHVEDEQNSDFTLSEGALEVHHLSANGVPIRDEQPVRIGAGESVQARTGVALARAKALRQVRIPRVNVKAEELPQPRADHMMHVRPSERPPRAAGAGSSMRRGALNSPDTARPRALRQQGEPAKPINAPKVGAAAKPNVEAQPAAGTEKKEDKVERKEEEKPKRTRRGATPRRRE